MPNNTLLRYAEYLERPNWKYDVPNKFLLFLSVPFVLVLSAAVAVKASNAVIHHKLMEGRGLKEPLPVLIYSMSIAILSFGWLAASCYALFLKRSTTR